MKAKMITALALICVSFIAKANGTNPFWVIESNAQVNTTIIRFYDTQNNLIYEDVVNEKLKIDKRKHRKFLDRKLKEVLEQEAVALNKKNSVQIRNALKR